MFSNDTVEVSVTFGSKITFFLRMISIAEETQLRQKAFGLKDEERAAKEYQLNVDILKDLADKMPTGLFPDPPEVRDAADESIYSDTHVAPFKAIEAFFAERTAVKERIAFYAVRGYFVRLQPSDFF
jgi:hypothetical protein